MKKKVLAMLLVGLFVTGSLFGCSKNQAVENEKDSSAKVTDTVTDTATDTVADTAEEPYHATLMYMVANDAADQTSVNEAINKLSKEQLNMTIDLMPVTIGTYMQQIQLVLSGGEPLDVFPIFSSNASTYIDSQYVVDLSGMINDKGKDILTAVGEDDVWCSSIDGFLYGVTTMRERANPVGLIVRTDILNETGIKAEDVKTLEDITALFAKVKELYPELTCYGGVNNLSFAQVVTTYDGLGDSFGVLTDLGQSTTVTNWFETDEFKSYVNVMRDWYLKGYSSQDLPTSTDNGEALMRAGNLFSFTTYYKPNTKVEKDSMTGYDTTVIPMNKTLLSTTTTAGVGYGIANNSENPEKAMELLNWLYSNKEVNDLLNWGVEGKDWEVKEDGTVGFPEGITAENCGYHQDFGWILPNQFIAHVWTGNDPQIFDKYQAFRSEATMSKAYGFSYKSAEVINELAAVTAVKDQYLVSICTGSVDPETAIPEFNKALYDAGLQKIIDQKQVQLDEWLATK